VLSNDANTRSGRSPDRAAVSGPIFLPMADDFTSTGAPLLSLFMQLSIIALAFAFPLALPEQIFYPTKNRRHKINGAI
jgi:hypothetical protein